MKKLFPLIFLVTAALGVGVIHGQSSFSHQTVFLSDVAGGNITFGQNFTANTFTVAGNQARFTVIEMNLNGSWSRLGVRNPNVNNTINITRLGLNYIHVEVVVGNASTVEFWLPDAGEPDTVTGGAGSVWGVPTLNVTVNANGNITLEWTGGAVAPTNVEEIVDLITSYIIILGLVPLILAGAMIILMMQTGEASLESVLFILATIIGLYVLLLVWVSMTAT